MCISVFWMETLTRTGVTGWSGNQLVDAHVFSIPQLIIHLLIYRRNCRNINQNMCDARKSRVLLWLFCNNVVQCSTSRSSVQNCGLWQQRCTISLPLQTTNRRDTISAALKVVGLHFLCVITSGLVNYCMINRERSQNIMELCRAVQCKPALSLGLRPQETQSLSNTIQQSTGLASPPTAMHLLTAHESYQIE